MKCLVGMVAGRLACGVGVVKEAAKMILLFDWTFTGGWKVMDTNAQVVDYLDDGYTAKVTLPAEPGVHNALSLEFRPCLAAEQSKIFDTLDKKGSEAANAVSVELVAAHIEKWDKTDRKGNPIAKSKDAVAKLIPPLLTKVIDAVIYGKLPDGVKLDLEADLKN